jgi:hypothetical protein
MNELCEKIRKDVTVILASVDLHEATIDMICDALMDKMMELSNE